MLKNIFSLHLNFRPLNIGRPLLSKLSKTLQPPIPYILQGRFSPNWWGLSYMNGTAQGQCISSPQPVLARSQ